MRRLSCYLNNYLYSFVFAYLQCIFCAPYLGCPFFSPLSIASLQTKTDACPSIKKRIKACYITFIGLPTSEILVPQYVSSECLMSDLITEPPITSNFIVHLVANKLQIDHISFFLIFLSSSNFFEYFALVFRVLFLWIGREEHSHISVALVRMFIIIIFILYQVIYLYMLKIIIIIYYIIIFCLL